MSLLRCFNMPQKRSRGMRVLIVGILVHICLFQAHEALGSSSSSGSSMFTLLSDSDYNDDDDNDSSSLALGQWKIQLKTRRPGLLVDAIFPPTTVLTASPPFDQQQSGKRIKQRSPFSSCECQLSVFANGTFALSSLSPIPSPSQRTTDASTAPNNNNDINRLPIHGRWYAPNNPYCATDRFYQDICFESYPRRQRRVQQQAQQQQKQQQSSSSSQQQADDDDQNNTPNILQRHQLVFHARLSGHFQRRKQQTRPSRKQSSGTGASPAAVGRLTHGKVLYQDLLVRSPPEESFATKVPWWRRMRSPSWPQRPVVASFNGQQISPFQNEHDCDNDDDFDEGSS